MADKRINDHIKTTTAANVDEFIIDSDANGTRNITYANLQTQVKQYVLGDMDEVPTQNSNNPVKSGGIFSTMAVPKYDSANRREYYEGGAAFDGNIDSSPTAGSNNAVASGGVKNYVDTADATLNTAIAGKAYIVKANTSDTKTFTIPKSIWTDRGLVGSNHTAFFCSGYASRISAGLLAISSTSVSVIKLGENNVSAAISGGNINITFTDTVYAQLYLVLFN